MADGPLHPGGGGAEPLGHLGVEDLGHRVDDLHVVHGDEDGLPKILVALDMGGDAHLVDDGGDQGLQTVGAALVLLYGLKSGELPDAGADGAEFAGLDHEVVGPIGGGQVGAMAPWM